MLPQILLDEHIEPETAYKLADLGCLVVPVRDRGLLGTQDWDLMPWCVANGFAICTANANHFRREHRQRRDRGEGHPGILLVRRDWGQEGMYRALRAYLEAGPDAALLANALVELTLPPPEG